MSITTRIQGVGPEVATIQDEALLVSSLNAPPLNVPNNIRPYAAFFTINGDGVSFDLTVDGSVNTVSAFVQADNTGDLYITNMSMLMGGAGTPALNDFCDLPALPIGLQSFYECCAEEFILAAFATTNYDLLRLATATPGHSTQLTGANSVPFLVENIDLAGNSAYNALYDFRTSIFPGGVRLQKGTQDKFGVKILDDLSGAGLFNIVLTGYRRL